MSNIERFNTLLNTTSDDRHKRWASFREQINNRINEVISRLGNLETAVIIGAGRCEDFSLSLLTKHFKRVVVSDVDVQSILNANEYKALSEEEKKKIEIVRVEYTGTENTNLFELLENELPNKHSFEQIDVLIDKGFKDVENYKFLKDYNADFVYISPIYTQLIYQQAMMILSKLRGTGYQENLIKYTEQLITDKLVLLFETFNKNVQRITNGYLMVASDVFQDYSNSDFMKKVKKNVSKEGIDLIYKEYFETYGFGMGDLGLFLLNDLFELEDYEWLIWPFNNDSDMVVKLSIYKK